MRLVNLKHLLHESRGVQRHTMICIAALLLMFAFVPMRADVDDCSCDTEIKVMANLAICIGGTNYVVDVYGCKRVGVAPTYLPAVCGPFLQNQYTNITKVCFVGVRPIPINPAATFSAILCAWDPCRTPGIMGATVGIVPNSVYCWTIFYPKCVGVDNTTGCIVKCGDGCCIIARQWTRQFDGTCLLTRSDKCTVATTVCNDPCVQLDCVDPVCCN